MSATACKCTRILLMQENLINGKVVDPKSIAKDYDVSIRTVLRDISELRTFYAEIRVQTGLDREIIYDRNNKGYKLINVKDNK